MNWYAVQESRGDPWDYGSYSYEKALRMLIDQGEGLIAIIEKGYCKQEITYEDVCPFNGTHKAV